MKTIVIEATPRTTLGNKKATKDLRLAEQVPCVLYGGKEVIHFHAHSNNIRHVVYLDTFAKADIRLDGKNYSAIVKDVQFHPLTDKVTHIDFLELSPGKKFRASVPLKFVGTAKGVKEGGTLTLKVRRVNVISTPEAISEVINVDVAPLELGKSLRVRDIKVAADTEIINSPSIPIATIDIPRALRSAQTKTAEKGKKKK